MHREKVKPKPKSHTSKEGSHKEDVSIWVQIIILLICLLVTILFLKYIDSTETLPKAPDFTDTPPVTPDIHEQYQPEPSQNQTDTPSKESTSTLDDVGPSSSKENEGGSPVDPKTGSNTQNDKIPVDTPPPGDPQSVNVKEETDQAVHPPKDSAKGKGKPKKKKSKGASESKPKVR